MSVCSAEQMYCLWALSVLLQCQYYTVQNVYSDYAILLGILQIQRSKVAWRYTLTIVAIFCVKILISMIQNCMAINKITS